MDKILNIGCGFDKFDGAINLDIDRRCNPDSVCDLTEGIPFESNYFDKVVANNVLEHLFNYESVMIEAHRVLKLGGVFFIEVPMWPSRVSIAGQGHIRQFVVESFIIYTNPAYYQPKKHPSDVSGLFDLINAYKNELPSGTGKPGEWITNLKVELEKVDKQYWQEKGVDKNIPSDVYGCFWCQHELKIDRTEPGKAIKKCTNCLSEFEIIFK